MRRAAAEPTLPAATRMHVDPGARAMMARGQLAWTIVMATCILLSESMFGACPDAGFALALGLGAAAAFPRQLHRGLLLAAGVVSVSLLAGLQGDGSSTMSLLVTPGLARDWSTRGLSGMQILAAGTATGLGVAWMSGPRDLHRMLQMGLAGAAATGLGTWAAGLLPAQTLRPELLPLLQGAVAGFISCQVLVFGMLRFTTVRRPPGPHRVNRTLAEGYRTPCLRAHELDTDLADRSPDTQTRDGLGEVAAWVYRLQWTLQDIDQQVATLDEPALRRRIQRMSDEAARTEDGFTADRKRATVQHLRRLLEHIHGLRGERTRTAALADYASAFLEEARAGLALAHLQPGEHIPPGLHDVLHRLRNHAQERDAHRQTADEMATLTA